MGHNTATDKQREGGGNKGVTMCFCILYIYFSMVMILSWPRLLKEMTAGVSGRAPEAICSVTTVIPTHTHTPLEEIEDTPLSLSHRTEFHKTLCLKSSIQQTVLQYL